MNEHSKSSVLLDSFQLQDFSEDYRLKALFNMLPEDASWSVLDLGSGNGVLADFKKDKYKKIILSDHSSVIVNKLKNKFQDSNNIIVLQIDAENFLLDDKVNLITATDIIEHLQNDVKSLRSSFKALTEGGQIFISVPAMPFLYGRRDKKYGHFRRYKKKELRQKLKEAGFKVGYIRYWNISGVLPYFISEKILKKELKGPSRSIKSIKDKIINKILYTILYVESKITFLPIGLTLIALARKNDK
ncbi:hypothetical protein COV42_03045 [Candidatus Campbellbacteria bacterium CG11_big_fil_rev_8_21_14_0_20_44_21]|uniref:Methyltransferase type 11 domain-containing protein n=1 Tax=Candidatus Campbellbacteria bacterium CG22_combo_CG10-13_8_21_14_all_43_18 TaxID=1974530 RepID=A0A2H0DWM2_9BACT|nr:MAG: hypothetical protein COW82_01370 [Candidatus Campbellbacteria bacterium CG22_combo_CG10-13_8_21_14_all_43_18]PIR24026.1 MAG: hypothetical protein COV42_03045 [Candidatus Campbellbacteria bacterium CG11_big_fil_rev_8_21_14_0_20_44_21]